MALSRISSPSLEALDPWEPTTPPERCSDLPTPPGTDDRRVILDSAYSRAIEVLRSCEKGSPACLNLKLTPQQYRKLGEEVEQNSGLHYVKTKLLYDYDPEAGVLEIRMPTPVHEIVSTGLADEITEGLRRVSNEGGSTGNFAARIVNSGSSRIALDEISKDDTILERQPDAQFGLDDAAYPGVVIEISYSQDGKDLDKLAWQYIQGSNGEIKVVIGIDINYHDKASTISLWRQNVYREEGDTTDTLDVSQEIKAEQFRSSDGLCENPTKTFKLSLNDFASDDFCLASNSVRLSIPYGRLADIVNRAERSRRARERRPGFGAKPKKIMKKRKRPSSSADEIDSEDEARYCRAASEAMAKVSDADEDFQPDGG